MLEVDMVTPIELSAELYENVSAFQKLANDKVIAAVTLPKFEDIWLEQMFDVVEPWERRIAELNTKKRFRDESVEAKFVSSFALAFKTLATVDLEIHGLRHSTAEKLVNSLLK